MSQDYISTLFEGIFFILAGLFILVSSVLDSYAGYQDIGLLAAIVELLPGTGLEHERVSAWIRSLLPVEKRQTTTGI